MPCTMTTCLIIFILVSAGRTSPVCGGDAGGANIYGNPSWSDCARRLSSYTSTLTDNRDHFFGLPSVTRRPQNAQNFALDVTINEWRNKVQLPLVARTLLFTPTSCMFHCGEEPASLNWVIHVLASCNIGLFPIELSDGSLSWDSGYYNSIMGSGQTVIFNCIMGGRNDESFHGPGGLILTGKILGILDPLLRARTGNL